MFKSKFITKLVALTLIACNISGVAGTAFASDNTNNFTKEFINASDDTIVCYMEGVPVKKSQIDENGVINEKTMNEIEQIVENEVSTYATSNTRVIPSGYNQAIVRTSLSAPGYGQTNTQYYYTYQNGAKFASGVEQKAWTTIKGTALGFVPKIGPAATILFTADSLYKASVAGKIRNYTNSGKKVKITEAKSRYGTFYGVFAWTNRTIETHKTFSDGTVEKITNLQYKK
ncbi:hypothetical protein [Romboutsia sp. 1001713B170131_170501_G6]|uniref:hypothetical protein n=1 Tax=Romboutsia sp. 1001713B170131_170501_G6 TaxID=2787108 RepID=UPI0018AB4DF3|nr:hypothetical protein [Romboutsia sp. 1001713B170131_170501_G6]